MKNMIVTPEEKPKESVTEQTIDAIKKSEEIFNKIKYGEIRIEIKNGIVYRCFVSESLLISNGREK